MEFDFVPWETDVAIEYLPMLPILLNGFTVGNALVDQLILTLDGPKKKLRVESKSN